MIFVSLIKRHILAILFFIFLLLLIFATYKDFGVAWDEKVYIQVGRHYLIQIFNRLHVPHNLSETQFIHGGIHIRTHGVFFDLIVLLTSLPFKTFTFALYHLIKAFYSVLIFFFLYLTVAKLLNKKLGLISMIFLLLIPSFFSFIFVNSIDIPTTLFFSLALWYFFYFIDSDQTFKKQVIFGIVMALIINQRAVFWYLMILNITFLFWTNYIKNKKTTLKTVKKVAAIFLSAFIFMHLTHPYLFKHPIIGIFTMARDSLKGFPFGAAVLFEGTFYQAVYNPLPWYYLPKSMLITIPPIILVLFFIGNIRLIFSDLHKKTSWQSIYLLLIFYIPLLLVIIFRPTLYDSWRQVLFLSVPMIIIAMYGLDSLMSNYELRIANYKIKLRYIFVLLILFSLFLTAKTIIRLHSYEYVYYNLLVGGLSGASGRYETDYWGLGYKEATLWFNKNVNDPKKNYKIFVEGDPLSSSTYFKPNMQLTTKVNEADYIFTFTRWNFHIRHPGSIIYTVQREKVPLIFIKELVHHQAAKIAPEINSVTKK